VSAELSPVRLLISINYPIIYSDFSSHINFNDKIPNMKLFADTFHDLCDAIEKINSIYAVHLTPTLLLMLITDIFSIYAIARHWMLKKETSETLFSVWVLSHLFYLTTLINQSPIPQISVNSFYFMTHFAMKSLIAHVGLTTTSSGEDVRTLVAKITNDAPPCRGADLSTSIFHNILVQLKTRNLKLKNIFFLIDWGIVLAVECSKFLFWNMDN
jgi:hypothetical protein